MSKNALFLTLSVKRRNGEERSYVSQDRTNEYVRIGFLFSPLSSNCSKRSQVP